MTLLEALDDPLLFAPWFRDRTTWAAWTAFLAALFGLPMTPEQLAVYRAHTGRTVVPIAQAVEAWLVCGRRAGKSFMLALIAVYLACFRSYREHLQPGERATVLIIATDRKQARTIFRYIKGLLTGVALLKAMIERETSDAFDLSNSVTIEIGTSSFKTVRGYTICAALCDELAFWPSDTAAEPDFAILDALRPAMATIPGAMLLCASSPHARRGALWDAYKRHYRQDGDVLVWKATTREMNPSVPQRTIDAAIERDPAVAAAEWLAEFRADLEAFLSREAVEACVSPGVLERAPIEGVTYSAFCDPSGGSSDSMTLAIGHRDGNVVILDCVREIKPPFKPDAVALEFAELLRTYRVGIVRGDRYGGQWPADAFKRHGIEYVAADKTKSEIYHELLPKVNGAELDLLDHPKLIAQLVSLERRVARGGKSSIDHPPGAGSHDDVANSVAGCAWLLRVEQKPMTFAAPIVITNPYAIDRTPREDFTPRWEY